MQRFLLIGIIFAIAMVAGIKPSSAACTVPNTLSNGTTADATQVMGNFNALSGCAPSVSGSPATGNLTQFSSPTAVTSGDLSGDVTTSGSLTTALSNTGVAAGSYSCANVTFDAKGRATAAASGSCGGGGGKFAAFPPGSTGWLLSYSAVMNVVHISDSITVTDLASLFAPVSGATYKMGIAGWNSSTLKITNSPSYTGSVTVSVGGGAPLYFSFGSPVVLTAGDYAVMIIRTDGTTTTSMSVNYGSGTYWAPRLYMFGSSTAYALTSQSPTTSDVWASQGSGWWDFGLMYTF